MKANSVLDSARQAVSDWLRPKNVATNVNIPALSEEQLIEWLRRGSDSASGVSVTETTAMRVATYFRCIALISGAMSWLPLDLIRRVSEKVREPAVDHPLRRVLTLRPNSWQTPAEFRRMLTSHLLMRGNGYARKVRTLGQVSALLPMHPDRVRVEQQADLSLKYTYTTPGGQQIALAPRDVLHLRGLSTDGVKGMSVLACMRETLGLSIASERSAANVFKNGNLAGGALTHPNKLSDGAYDRLRESMKEKTGAERAGEWLILEEGLTPSDIGFSAEDMQLLESRDFNRYEICIFLGVPPHMVGLTSKVSSWGSGVEQQGIGFVTYTLNDYIAIWEQSLRRDCLEEREWGQIEPKIFTAGLLRGDIKTRYAVYTQALQWGIMNPDETRGLEDMNPRADGKGGEYYPPPNQAAPVEPEREPGDRNNDDPPTPSAE